MHRDRISITFVNVSYALASPYKYIVIDHKEYILTDIPSIAFDRVYEVRAHEVDAHRRIKPPALLMLMQEGSMHNANDLGFSMWHDLLNNASWVILRKEVVINRLPTLGEEVRIITYPAGLNRVFAYRDFWVLDKEGNTLACASSTWVLMDLDKRKMVALPELMKEIQEIEPGHRLPLPQQKLRMSEDMDHAYTYQVGHYDLDWNHHVNNIVMTKLMLQAVSQEVYETQILKSYDMQVKSEILAGEEVHIQLAKVDDQYHHQLAHADGSLIAQAVSSWQLP